MRLTTQDAHNAPDVHFVDGAGHWKGQLLSLFSGGAGLMSIQKGDRQVTVIAAHSSRPQTGTWHYADEGGSNA